MNIAELIVKVVRATANNPYYASGTELHSSKRPTFGKQGGGSSHVHTGTNGQAVDPFSGNTASCEASGEGYTTGKGGGGASGPGGITKIVQTRITSRRRDEEGDEDGSSESSTRNLQHHHGHGSSFG